MFPVDDVIFFQSDTKYTRVVTESEDVLIRTSLRELLDGLDPEIFWQVHRSAIVNVNRITRITRDGVEKALPGAPRLSGENRSQPPLLSFVQADVMRRRASASSLVLLSSLVAKRFPVPPSRRKLPL